MNERFQLASEETYDDLTNLRSKLMKHAAFEAELESNKTKIIGLKKVSVLEKRSILLPFKWLYKFNEISMFFSSV